MNIIEPIPTFDFSKLSLAHPSSVQGGSYFTKILCDDKPLYVQTPRCATRQGFIKNNKKIICDLMFETTCDEFVQWIENLEIRCQQLIFEKSKDWFQNEMDISDIETAFTSVMKIYKSGRYYLVRGNVKTQSLSSSSLITPLIKIYNENETPVLIDEITSDNSIISILEIQGIKFTTRNFQIEIEVKQVMVLNKENIFENCLIKKSKHESLENSIVKEKEESFTNCYETPSEKEHEYDNKYDNKYDNIIGESRQDIKDANELELVDLDNMIIDNTNDTIPPNKEIEGESIDLEKIVNEAIIEERVDSIKQPHQPEPEDQYQQQPQEHHLEEQHIIKSFPLVLSTPQGSNLAQGKDPIQNSNNLIEIQPSFDFDLENADSLEVIKLKKPNEVYYEIYKQAKEKAKAAKKEAIVAYLEAKNIKKTYMLDNLESSSDEGSIGAISDEDDV